MVNTIKNEKKYTYEDYLTWDDGKRWEIIDGVVYLMSPAPSSKHQRILFNLGRKFGNYLENKKCEIFPAPFDVRLPKKGEPAKKASTTVQPDITIICDPDKIDETGCNGSPDLIVEILSPSTSKKDMTIKFNIYQEHGVPEYWIVDPHNHTVARFYLNETQGKYEQAEYFYSDDVIRPIIFPELEIKLEEVFPVVKKFEDVEETERI